MNNNTIKFARLITFLLVFIYSYAGNTKNMTIFDFSFEDIDGNLVNLNKFKGKPIFMVNTASRCGFTPQYENLQNLFINYRNTDLTILAITSNSFNQEYTNALYKYTLTKCLLNKMIEIIKNDNKYKQNIYFDLNIFHNIFSFICDPSSIIQVFNNKELKYYVDHQIKHMKEDNEKFFIESVKQCQFLKYDIFFEHKTTNNENFVSFISNNNKPIIKSTEACTETKKWFDKKIKNIICTNSDQKKINNLPENIIQKLFNFLVKYGDKEIMNLFLEKCDNFQKFIDLQFDNEEKKMCIDKIKFLVNSKTLGLKEGPAGTIIMEINNQIPIIDIQQDEN